MNRALIWKEYREQRLTSFVLPAIAAALVAVLPLAAPSIGIPTTEILSVRQGVLILFAVLCGIVGGAQHWAADIENGTLPFLDMMPVPRARLWFAKTIYAVAQWGLQMIALAVIALVAAAIPFEDHGLSSAAAVLGMSALLLSVNVATSAYAKTVLGAIGRSVPFGIFLPVAGLIAIDVVMNTLRFRANLEHTAASAISVGFGILMISMMLIVPLAISYRHVSAVDRSRGGEGIVRTESPRMRAFRAAWGLAMHDTRSMALPLAVLMAPNFFLATSEPVLAWLFTGSLIGAYLGLTVTDAEKQGGAFKLWGDQRLPVGTLWGVKVLHRLMILMGCFLVILLTVAGAMFFLSQASGNVINRSFAVRWASAVAVASPYSFLPLIGHLFGFGAGLVFPLITPKKILALFGAALTGLTATIFWLPMIGSGGLTKMQWVGVPLVFAITARVLVWPWAVGRLNTRTTLAGLVLPLLAVAGYWYGVEQARIAAVPKVGPILDEAAFMSVMNTTQASQAGDQLKEVISEVATLRDQVVRQVNETRNYGEVDAGWGKVVVNRFQSALEQASKEGIGSVPEDARKALDHILSGSWVAKIDALTAADVEYANLGPITGDRYEPNWYDGRRTVLGLAGEMLLIDALIKDQAGDAAGALDRIDQAFRVSRWLGHRVAYPNSFAAAGVTNMAIQTLNYWMEGRTAKGDVDLLRKANALIERHLSRSESAEDRMKSEYFATKQSIEDSRNLMREFVLAGPEEKGRGTWGDLSVAIWSSAIGIEPEVERRRRIYDLWVAGYIASARTDHATLFAMEQARGSYRDKAYFYGVLAYNHFDWVTPLVPNPSPERNEEEWRNMTSLGRRDVFFNQIAYRNIGSMGRDTARKLAFFKLMELANMLRAHRLTHGEWPKTLADLKAEGFGPVPGNPMTGQPFIYSVGENAIILKAPDLFETVRKTPIRKGFSYQGNGQRFELEFEIPTFVRK
jgi:ABC-type transport system involved in cytochrome c biogenesis permease component